MRFLAPLIRWHKTNRLIILVVGLAVVVGGASGVVGELITRGWLLQAVANTPQLADLNNQFYTLLSKYQLINTRSDQPLEVVIRRAGAATGLQVITQVASGGVGETARQGTVTFYPARTTTTTDPLAAAYQAEDQLGHGVIITNDGWLVTTRQVLPRLAGQVAVTTRGDSYVIDQIVTDPLTEFVLVKIAAANLPVVTLAKTLPAVGSGYFTLTGTRGFTALTVTDQHRRRSGRPAYSTERFDEYVQLTDAAALTPGRPVFNDQGGVVGLTVAVEGALVVRPLANLSPQVEQAFTAGQISRPQLGVDYLLLDQLAFPPTASLPYQQLRRGALVYRNTRLATVGITTGSPAAAADIRVGDVILKVDGMEVTSDQPLTDLIQTYRVGDDVTLTLWREGGELTATVTLKPLVK